MAGRLTGIDAGVEPDRSLLTRLTRRIRDTPWRMAQFRDSFFPTTMGGLHAAVRPYTMVGYGRLLGLYKAVNQVIAGGIPGDIVECGSARGGSAALMGLVLKKSDPGRRLWVFDSFEGQPPPSGEDPDYEKARHYTGAWRGSIEEVSELFDRLGLSNLTVLVKGRFADTLEKSDVRRIAVLHIDADWYESVKICLDKFWDRLAPGGIVQVDDYGEWAGARKAVHQFVAERALNLNLHYVDFTGRQLVKPG
jgi:O-methyltransferase